MTTMTGDAAGMRAAAAQLRLRADEVGRTAAQADAGVAGMGFAGPAADRWRSGVAQHVADLRAASARMVELADNLTRQAAIVEQEAALRALRGGA
jgi:hypothetical protein